MIRVRERRCATADATDMSLGWRTMEGREGGGGEEKEWVRAGIDGTLRHTPAHLTARQGHDPFRPSPGHIESSTFWKSIIFWVEVSLGVAGTM